MTVPTIESATSFGSATNSTTHTFTYPTVDAGDLLILLHNADGGTPDVPSLPAGPWEDNRLAEEGSPGVYNHSYAVSYIICDGTETGTFDVTMPSAEGWAGWLLRIKNHHGVTPPEISVREANVGAGTDDVTLTPTGWDSSADDTLWVWFCATNGDSITMSSWPANMPDNQSTNDPGASANSPTAFYATDDTSAATRTSGTATLSAAQDNTTMLIGIRGVPSTSIYDVGTDTDKINGTSNLTLTYPQEIQADDFAVILTMARDSGRTAKPPEPEYTQEDEDLATDGTQVRTWVYSKVLTGSETSVTITTVGASSRFYAMLLIFRGVDTTTPLDVSLVTVGDSTYGNDTTPNHANAAITPVTDNGALILAHCIEGTVTMTTPGAPATPTGLSSVIFDPGAEDIGDIYATFKNDYGSAALISPGAWTHSFSGSGFIGGRIWSIALRPASGSSGIISTGSGGLAGKGGLAAEGGLAG